MSPGERARSDSDERFPKRAGDTIRGERVSPFAEPGGTTIIPAGVGLSVLDQLERDERRLLSEQFEMMMKRGPLATLWAWTTGEL